MCSSDLFGYLGVIASVTSPQVVFAFLINASGAVMLFIYLFIAFAQIKNRRRLEKTNPELLQVKMWLFPWASYAAIAAITARTTSCRPCPGYGCNYT